MSTALWLALVVAALACGVALGARRRPPPQPAAEPAGPAEVTHQDDAFGNLPRALHDLPLGIVIADAGGTIVYRNALAETYADARHSEAIVEAAIGEVITGTFSERTLDLYGPPRRHLSVKVAPITAGGRRTGSLVIVEDVTEQHRIDAIRRDFVANVSHELKTPVGAIGLLAEALRGEDDPEVVDRLAGRLQSEAIRLGHTIDDLLALSRIESGELVEPAEIDLAEVVIGAIERNHSAAELREVTVSAEGVPEPVVVLGDRRQLVTAVGNLVDNAVKYSDPGSEVTVSVDVIGDRGRIRVTDRGVGIPEADLERIFERFYRVDPARSRNTGGTGLGLSIVRHVAINHGGDVTVDSAEGQGSTFALAIPLAYPPRPAGDRWSRHRTLTAAPHRVGEE
jgi:two-component system sensor histidine kinase SenX3